MQKTNFSEILSELMQDYQLNSVGLQKLSGCSNQSISMWLNRNVLPKPDSLLKLSVFFSCSIDYLLGLTENKAHQRNGKEIDFIFRLSYLKNKFAVSYYKIAKTCNFANNNITAWQNKGLLPRTECIIDIAQFFGCKVEYLLGISDAF